MATVQTVPLSRLKAAAFNPESRTSSKGAIGTLAKSIKEHGMLYPILVTDKLQIVDGHRRVAAYKKLGFPEIEVITVRGDQATAFAQANSETRKLTANQTLQVFLQEPLAIAERIRKRLEDAEEVIGRRMLLEMAEKGFSRVTFAMAEAICKAADQDTPDTIRQVIRWMMKYGCANMAHKAMLAGTAPGTLIKAAREMRPVKPVYALARRRARA